MMHSVILFYKFFLDMCVNTFDCSSCGQQDKIMLHKLITYVSQFLSNVRHLLGDELSISFLYVLT
jgi:hypothetical protein